LAYRICHAEAVAFEHSRGLLEALRRNTPDCIEFADFQGYAFYALRDSALRRRMVLRVHTPLYLVYREAGKWLGIAYALLRFRERDCLRKARWITAPSGDFIREKLSWLKNYRVIPNPPPTLGASKDDGRNAQPALPGTENAIVPDARPSDSNPLFRIAFLGRLEPRKGARELLEAFLSLVETHADATLSFIGDAADVGYREALEKRLAKAPEPVRAKISWLPAHSGDKSDLLAGFSCLAIPSLWENCPYVFWEGMAAGIPCLGSETGEMKRARVRIGYPPVRPADAASLAEALLALISFPELRRQLVTRQNAYLLEVAGEAEALPAFFSECSAHCSASD
jgi:glycosyltransferase involved in cell wall biosynthesis